MPYKLIPGEEYSLVKESRGWDRRHELNGKKLEDGESVLVRFPDGTEEEKIVLVERYKYTQYDMGNQYDAYGYRSFIKVTYHDAILLVSLEQKGICARRIK